MSNNTITISKKEILQNSGVVVLPIKEYRKLLQNAVQTYYLKGKKAKELDKLVDEGLKEYRDGRTISADSIEDAMKIYEKRNKKN